MEKTKITIQVEFGSSFQKVFITKFLYDVLNSLKRNIETTHKKNSFSFKIEK